jgi:hypothetical protein
VAEIFDEYKPHEYFCDDQRFHERREHRSLIKRNPSEDCPDHHDGMCNYKPHKELKCHHNNHLALWGHFFWHWKIACPDLSGWGHGMVPYPSKQEEKQSTRK